MRHAYAARVAQGWPCPVVCRYFIFLVLIGFLLCTTVEGLLVSSSSIEYCINEGPDKESCKKKMVVTLAVDGDQLPGAEEVAFVKSAEDNTDGKNLKYFKPIRLTTSRSAVKYRYPIVYERNFNAKPYEENIMGSLLNQCNADFSRKATCGLALNDAGEAIRYSQGFCCGCGLCATLGLCTPDARATKACNVLNDYTIASCLRFSPLWYGGYNIKSGSTWYTLNVSFRAAPEAPSAEQQQELSNRSRASALTDFDDVLQISPDNPNAGSKKHGVQVRHIGDMFPGEQPLVLIDRMFFTPVYPRNDPRVLAGPREWLILPYSMVTVNGRECDKVGVSYEAFSSQGNMCRLSRGSCLASQLEDHRKLDLAAISKGKAGKYFVSSYGDFDLERFEVDGKRSPYLTYIPASPPSSMITIAIDTEHLQYIMGVASGVIVNASVNQPVMEALTSGGVINVTVMNTGEATARFTVNVRECTRGIFPVRSQVVSLAPAGVRGLHFDVSAEDEAMDSDANCTVQLYNAMEDLLDTRLVQWKVVPTKQTNGTQGGNGPDDGGESVMGKDHSKCSQCRTFLDIPCVFRNACVGSIFGVLGLFLGIAIAAFLLFRNRKTVWRFIKWLVDLCTCDSPTSSSKWKSHSDPYSRPLHSSYSPYEPPLAYPQVMFDSIPTQQQQHNRLLQQQNALLAEALSRNARASTFKVGSFMPSTITRSYSGIPGSYLSNSVTPSHSPVNPNVTPLHCHVQSQQPPQSRLFQESPLQHPFSTMGTTISTTAAPLFTPTHLSSSDGLNRFPYAAPPFTVPLSVASTYHAAQPHQQNQQQRQHEEPEQNHELEDERELRQEHQHQHQQVPATVNASRSRLSEVSYCAPFGGTGTPTNQRSSAFSAGYEHPLHEPFQ